MMNRLLFCCLACVWSFLLPAQTLHRVKKFGKNPGHLTMYEYVPTAHVGKRPLVVVLHGCTETAAACARLTGWNTLADRNSFYVLYPEQQMLNNPNRCFNWFEAKDQVRGKGEAASIVQMIETMKRMHDIDTNRIYISGLSAGAAMATILMSVYPNVFEAGAVFAGGPYGAASSAFNAGAAMAGRVEHSAAEWGDLVRKQNPEGINYYPRLLIFQGTSDPIVNPKNADALVAQWTNLTLNDTAIWITDSLQGNADIKRTSYYDRFTGEVFVERIDIRNFPHAVVLDTGACPCQSGKTGLWGKDRDFNGVAYAASFFGLLDSAAVIAGPDKIVYIQTYSFAVPYHEGSVYTWSIAGGAGEVVGGQGRSWVLVAVRASCTLEVVERRADGCVLPPARRAIQVRR